MRKIETLATWIMGMLPRHHTMTIAIAPGAIGMEPKVYIVTECTGRDKSSLIEANPRWLVGVFKNGVDRETVRESIRLRYEEIEQDAEYTEALRRG